MRKTLLFLTLFSALFLANRASAQLDRNLALNRPVVVSSTASTSLAGSYAVDGNPSTRWSSLSSDPQWIYVDLGQSYKIQKVIITWETAYARNYQLQVSDDATNWTTILTRTNNTMKADTNINLTGKGRYLRMYGTTRATGFGYSIYELEVYGDNTDPNQPIVNSFSPMVGQPGTVVTIAGRGFNTNPTKDYVFFGSANSRATVLTATATQLTVSVPSTAVFNSIGVVNTDYPTLLGTSLGRFALIEPKSSRYQVMDMVQNDPGLPLPPSKFTDPKFLDSLGYTGKVFFVDDSPQFGITWDSFNGTNGTIFPAGSASRNWVLAKDAAFQKEYSAAKNAGLRVYCFTDMVELPTSLVNKYKDSICNSSGKIDISKPFTQKCFRYLMDQIFSQYPQLDGLIIRTGETYLQGIPYHSGNNPIQNGLVPDHITLIKLLKDEVCVKLKKDIIYRTWDFGQFHTLPQYYRNITDSIAPDPHLYFSIKHTNVDFWRNGIPAKDTTLNFATYGSYFVNEASAHGVWFNPCLGIGYHKQIVEIECQREYEGKPAHPNYISKGVLDGFQELNKPGLPKINSLNKIKSSPLFSGVWTWSRGGGWGGPTAMDEFWPELNAYVISKWAQDTTRTELSIFTQFAKAKGLSDAETAIFHKLCLQSDTGILRGQYSEMGGVYVNWTRDNTIAGWDVNSGYVKNMVTAGTIEKYLAEKADALRIWKQIEAESQQLHFNADTINHFVRVSCTYGRIKFQYFNAIWNILLRGTQSDQTKVMYNVPQMQRAIRTFDDTYTEWQALVANNKDSPTIYDVSGIQSYINPYRIQVKQDTLKSFTATLDSGHVKLDWNIFTRSANHFVIYHSTDGKTGNIIFTVNGSDTTTSISNYEKIDLKPAQGTNYYLLAFYDANNKLLGSKVATINIAQLASLSGFAAALNGLKVDLNWTTSAEAFNRGFVIQRKTVTSDWVSIDSVASNANHAYQRSDNSPVKGMNYYRLGYLNNGQVTVSPIQTVNYTSSATVVNFTATAVTGPKAQFNWSTTFERVNPGFLVQRSTDNVNWITVASIAGKGSTTATNSYQAFDNSPVAGTTNLYRLGYLSNGKDTASATKSITFPQTTALMAYPNPTNAAITFTLKNYTGKTFTVTLSNTMGKVYEKQTMPVSALENYTLKSRPPVGAYILKVSGTGLEKDTRVLIQ